MFNYKTVKRKVPWCKTCDCEIYGDGSILNYYYCKCGKYEFKYDEDGTGGDYILIKY